ncbi:MAG: hypothetical protein ACK46I_00080 [Phycisphaerae bacterium]
MSPTRLLILSASAFSLGLTVPAALAQEASQQSGATASPTTSPAWRNNAQSRSRMPQQGVRGVIRVAPPLVNNDEQAAPSIFNNYTNQPPAAVRNTRVVRPSANANTRRNSGIAMPENERRPVGPRGQVRSNLRAPSIVRIARENNDATVRLTWNDSSGNERGFVVQRRQAIGNGWSEPVELQLPANSEGVLDTPGEGTYAYRVAASSTSGRSWFSDWQLASLVAPLPQPTRTAQASSEEPAPQPTAQTNNTEQPQTTNQPPAPPVAPALASGVNGSDTGARGASLSWDSATGSVTNYQLEREPAFPTGLRVFSAEQRSFSDNTGVGTYRYRVRAMGPGGNSDWSEWTQIDVADIIPVAPAQLAGLDLGDGVRVRLNWRDNADNETRFRVERQTQSSDGSWAGSTALIVAPNTTQQIDTPGAGTHRYRIAAVGSAGVSSFTAWMPVTVAQITLPDVQGEPTLSSPLAPVGFDVTDNNNRRAGMTWQDVSDNESSFELERIPAFGEGRVRVAANTTVFIDNSGDGEFQYRVRAINAAGASEWSPWVNVSVADTAPTEPVNLALVDGGDNQRVTITWSDASDNESAFRIEHQRNINGSWSGTRIVTALPNREQQVDVPGPGTHRYRVASINASGLSSFTQWREITIAAPQVDPQSVVPAAPGGVSATDQTQRAGVVWSDASDNEQGFELERNPAFGARVLLNANVTGYIDNTGPGGFAYRVRAYNNAGYSNWTSWANVNVSETAPAAPLSVVAMDAGNQNGVNVTWIDSSPNEDGFRIEREKWLNNAWNATQTYTLSPNSDDYSDTPGLGRFRYRVQAFNDGGDSSWSTWVVVNVTDGWTPITLAPGAREVFVSSSMGSDSNSGLSADQPVRTLYRGYQLVRAASADHMRLRRGDVWVDQAIAGQYGSWDKAGRSAAEPIVIHTYGDNPNRPIIKAGVRDIGMRIQGGDPWNGNLWIVGVHFQANRRMPTDPDFNPNTNVNGLVWYGRGGNLLVEDCVFEYYSMNITMQPPTAADVITGVTFRRSQILNSYAPGSHSQGFYVVGVNGMLVDECLVDHNGWLPNVTGTHSTIFNHNFYLVPSCTNVLVRNTITSRASATGIQMRGRNMNSFNNLSLKNPLGITAGHAMASPEQNWTGSMRYNVVLDGADIGVPNTSTFAPRGFGMSVHRSTGGVLERNIIAHNVSAQGGEPAILHGDLGSTSLTLAENIVYDWQGAPVANQPRRGLVFRLDSPLPSAAVLRDNWFIQPDGGAMVATAPANGNPGGAWRGNRYFTANPSNEGWFFTQSPQSIIDPATWAQRTNQAALSTNDRDQVLSNTPSFPDPSRTMASYAASIGLEPSLEAFLAEARKQSRNNWRPELTAAAVNRYIREGFGLPEPDAGSQPEVPGAGYAVVNE